LEINRVINDHCYSKPLEKTRVSMDATESDEVGSGREAVILQQFVMSASRKKTVKQSAYVAASMSYGFRNQP